MRTGARKPRVVYEIGAAVGGPKLTVGLDERGDFRFTVTDDLGEQHSVVVEGNRVRSRWLFVVCELIPLGSKHWRAAVSLGDQPPATEEFEAELAKEVRAQQGLGGNLFGEKNAAFNLSEMMAFANPLTEEAKQQLRGYVKGRYGELQ
jgi:hypothetical protein